MRKLTRSPQRGAWIGIGMLALIVLAFGVYMIYLTYGELQKDDIDLIRLNWLAIAVLGYLVVISGLIKAADHGRETHWLFSLIGELNSEFTGALVTGILFLVVLAIPSERQAERELQERLIREMGSQNNGIALQAVGELKAQDWLFDGTLRNQYFVGANLTAADLWFADVQAAILWDANFSSAELVKANLSYTDLSNANLQGADLSDANFSYANLWRANLQESTLKFTNFDQADLAEADFSEAAFEEDTILPDGSNWSPDTDMARFTDPDHPNFWRSSDPASPAYAELSPDEQ